MASRTFAYVFLQAIVMQVVFGQAINRVIPLEALLSNQLISFAPNLVSLAPNVCEPVLETVVQAPCAPVVSAPVVSAPLVQQVPSTTIIQDSTVANNLANALQLLIVSNLLSNTLPTMGDVLVPSPIMPSLDLVSPVVSGLGPVSYVY